MSGIVLSAFHLYINLFNPYKSPVGHLLMLFLFAVEKLRHGIPAMVI